MSFDLDSSFNFFPMPTDLHFGHGVLAKLPEQVKSLGGSRVLVVTDEGVQRSGTIARAQQFLSDAGLGVSIFDRVQADSGSGLITEATRQLVETDSNVVVGMGGGSSLDTAKAVAVLAANGGAITDYVGMGKVKKKPLPVIAIPTTAGTGSEVSLWSVFTDDSKSLKVAIGGFAIYPVVALCDPDLTLSLPPFTTAATGMDALTHAIECYTNKACQPISGTLALRAIGLIGQHLRTAVLNGEDRKARFGMLLASTMAGMAMNPTRLGLAHALAMPLGSWKLRVPHGVANAITLPFVMRFNCLACPHRFLDIARALGERVDHLSERQGALQACEAVRCLAEDVGIPKGLGQFGVKEEHVPSIVDEAMKSGNVLVNPRSTSAENLEKILRQAL
jgi:alcohol dehydrogenase class IV